MTDRRLNIVLYLATEGHKLAEAHGGVWGEHPDHSKDIWSEEVQGHETILGYWEWVAAREADDES